MHNYVDNFLVFALSHGVLKTVFRRGESILETVFGTFPSRSPKPAKSVLRIDSLVSWFLRVPLRNSLQSSAPTDPSQRGSHEESNVSNPLPRRIHQNPPEATKTALSESQSKSAVFVSEALCQLVLLCLRRTVSSIT